MSILASHDARDVEEADYLESFENNIYMLFAVSDKVTEGIESWQDRSVTFTTATYVETRLFRAQLANVETEEFGNWLDACTSNAIRYKVLRKRDDTAFTEPEDVELETEAAGCIVSFAEWKVHMDSFEAEDDEEEVEDEDGEEDEEGGEGEEDEDPA